MQQRNRAPINRWLLLSVALLLAGANVMGQDSPDIEKSAGFFNGRFWEGLDVNAKLAFFLGFEQGVRAGALDLLQSGSYEETVNTYIAKGFTNGDLIKELDKLYSARENILLPIPVAIAYSALKLGGTRTNAELEQMLIQARKTAFAPAEKRP